MTRATRLDKTIIAKRPAKAALCMCLILALSGCVQTVSDNPAPAIHYGLRGGADSAGMHTVSGDETLWAIAQRYKLAMPDIIYLNGLRAPYDLAAGQRLHLPPPHTYKVRRNDTLYGISRTFSVSMTDLARLNSLSPPYSINPGDTLRLPSAAPRTVAAAPRPAAVASPAESASLPPARVAAVTAEPLAPAMPGKKASVTPTPVSASTVIAKTPPRAGSKFIWPVDGSVLSSYGPKAGGLHNDGINIKAPRGVPVRAAENGIVAYAGNELKGFGNLVLIRHADRWVTAYAHLDRLHVERGQEIKQGQTIGTVGQTGSVDSPQLHFEVRRGAEALNPKPYLAQRGI